jgi:hypothetical protein
MQKLSTRVINDDLDLYLLDLTYFLSFIATWQNTDFRAGIDIFTEISTIDLLAGIHEDA